jgi:K+-transporting ATPase A subunit
MNSNTPFNSGAIVAPNAPLPRSRWQVTGSVIGDVVLASAVVLIPALVLGAIGALLARFF